MDYNGSTYANFGGANPADSYDFSYDMPPPVRQSAFGGGGGFANPQANYGYSNPVPQSPPPYTPSYAGDFSSIQQQQPLSGMNQQQTAETMQTLNFLASQNPGLAAQYSAMLFGSQPQQQKYDPNMVPDPATMWREIQQVKQNAAVEAHRAKLDSMSKDLEIKQLRTELQNKGATIAQMESDIEGLTQHKDYLMALVEDYGNAIATIEQGGQAMFDNLDHRMEVQGRLMKGLSFRVGDVEETLASMGGNNGNWRRAWSSSPLLRLTAPPSAASSSSGSSSSSSSNVKKSSCSSNNKPLLLLAAPPPVVVVPATPLACGAAAGFDASSSSLASSSSCSSSPRSAAASESESEAGCSAAVAEAAEAPVNAAIDNNAASCSTPTVNAVIDNNPVASTSGLTINLPLLNAISVPSALNALAAPASSSSSSRSLLKMGLFAAVYAVRLVLDVRRVGVKAVVANAIISLASG